MQGSTQSGDTRDELYDKARRLETEAIESVGDGPADRALRAEAAELRRRALGERIYPILICTDCLRLTGRVDASGQCDSCLRRDQLEAAYSDPHSGWVVLTNAHSIDPPPRLPLRARLAGLAGLRGPLERAMARAWLSRVEPDETGPVEAEVGYELEVAQRDDVEAADGSGIVVRFTTATHRFTKAGWLQLETTRISRSDTLTPPEFSAGLPMEQLAEAWGDYRAEVVIFNRAAWARESERRETERRARAERESTLREQRDVAALLDESSS